jgi:hypothetical protein
MNIINSLSQELAIDDNISYFLEIEKLIPTIKSEYCISKVRPVLESTPELSALEFHRHGDILRFASKTTSDSGFTFSVYLGVGDKNWYYGVIGPWNKPSEPIAKLKKAMEVSGYTYWSEWMFKYFTTINRSSFLNPLESGDTLDLNLEKVKVEILQLVNDFMAATQAQAA